MAATARINLARVMRATGQHDAAQALLHQCDDWYRTAGGGDGALLTRALLATADAAALAAVTIVDEVDRLDAHRARELLSGERQVTVLAARGAIPARWRRLLDRTVRVQSAIPPGRLAPGSARCRSGPGTPPAARRLYPAAVRSGSRAGSG